MASAAEIATLTEQVRQLKEVNLQLAATTVSKAVCDERCKAWAREMAAVTARQTTVEQRPVRWLPIALTAVGVLVAAASLVVSLAI